MSHQVGHLSYTCYTNLSPIVYRVWVYCVARWIMLSFLWLQPTTTTTTTTKTKTILNGQGVDTLTSKLVTAPSKVTELVKLQPIASKARRDSQNQKQPGYSWPCRCLILTIPGFSTELHAGKSEVHWFSCGSGIWTQPFHGIHGSPCPQLEWSCAQCALPALPPCPNLHRALRSAQALSASAPWCTVPSGGTYSWSRRIFRKKSLGSDSSDGGKICWNSISKPAPRCSSPDLEIQNFCKRWC